MPGRSYSKASSGPSGSFKDARPKKHQIATGDPEDDNDSGWNIFDQVETETVLPPNPLRTKWMKESLNISEAPDDDVQPVKRAGRPKKEVRKSRSNVNRNTSQKRKTPKLHPRIPQNLLTGSSTDVDTSLLSKVTKRHRLLLLRAGPTGTQ